MTHTASKRELARVLVCGLRVIQRYYNHLVFINCLKTFWLKFFVLLNFEYLC